MALNDISCGAWPSNINLKWNRLGGEAGKEESMISVEEHQNWKSVI